MKHAIRLSAILAVLAAFAAPAGFSAISEGDELIRSTADHTVSAETQAYLDKGDQRASEGQYGYARIDYRKAEKQQRAEGQIPVESLRRIANSHYFEGNYHSAAATLDRLADEAAEYGDLVTQVWAIADAAWIEGIGGREIDMKRHVAQLEKLLGSQYLPDEVRAEVVSTRLGDDAQVATR
jgi:hypothetical protein